MVKIRKSLLTLRKSICLFSPKTVQRYNGINRSHTFPWERPHKNPHSWPGAADALHSRQACSLPRGWSDWDSIRGPVTVRAPFPGEGRSPVAITRTAAAAAPRPDRVAIRTARHAGRSPCSLSAPKSLSAQHMCPTGGPSAGRSRGSLRPQEGGCGRRKVEPGPRGALFLGGGPRGVRDGSGGCLPTRSHTPLHRRPHTARTAGRWATHVPHADTRAPHLAMARGQ